MVRVHFNKIVQLIIFISIPSLSLWADNFIAASDIWTPFFQVNGEDFSGIGVDIVKEIFRRTGDSLEISYLPTKRAIIMFDANEVDLMLIDSPLWSDPEKNNFVFSENIISVKEYIYFLKDNAIEVTNPIDLKGKSVAIMRGYYYPGFEEAFKTDLVSKEEVDKENSLVLQLFHKRTDAIFMDSIAFQHTILALGYKPELFTRGMQLSDAPLGLKIRKEKAEALPRINSAIESMKLDGSIDKIIKKYTSYLNKE